MVDIRCKEFPIRTYLSKCRNSVNPDAISIAKLRNKAIITNLARSARRIGWKKIRKSTMNEANELTR